MVSADMCKHDWPGSGCKECRAEREASNHDDIFRTISGDDLLRAGLISFAHNTDIDPIGLIDAMGVGFVPGTWYPISYAPTDDQEFYIGRWVGDSLWDAANNEYVFTQMPQWQQTISHHENPQGPHLTRGWNHRNGPLGGNATHWSPLLKAPEFKGRLAQKGCP